MKELWYFETSADLCFTTRLLPVLRIVLIMDHGRLYEYLGAELAVMLEHTSLYKPTICKVYTSLQWKNGQTVGNTYRKREWKTDSKRPSKGSSWWTSDMALPIWPETHTAAHVHILQLTVPLFQVGIERFLPRQCGTTTGKYYMNSFVFNMSHLIYYCCVLVCCSGSRRWSWCLVAKAARTPGSLVASING